MGSGKKRNITSYRLSLRRITPARPIIPVPNRIMVPGSGVAPTQANRSILGIWECARIYQERSDINPVKNTVKSFGVPPSL